MNLQGNKNVLGFTGFLGDGVQMHCSLGSYTINLRPFGKERAEMRNAC